MANTTTSGEPVTATSFANGDLLRLSQDLGGSTFGNAKIDWVHVAAQIAALPKSWTTIISTPTTLGGYGITDAVPTTRTVNGHALSSNVTVTASDTNALPISGGTLTGALTLSADPVSSLQPATKQYVDLIAQGLSPKNSALVSTTANITLLGEQTIDGILTSASRVLVWQQTLPATNGIYTSGAGAWVRTSDADTWAELAGALLLVEEGSTNADQLFVCTSDPGGTLGVTAVTFSKFSGSVTPPAGSDTQVQFNNAGAFGASATFKFKLTPTPTLIFGDVLTGADLIVASDTGVSGHVDGRNLIINGGDGFDNGASGNAAGGGLEFSGGDSHGASDAGDAEIGGGNAADSGTGGPAFVFGGNSNSGTGGDVHLNPGNSTSGTKGKISGKIPGGADVTLFDQAMALPLARLPSVATGNYLANLSGGTATPSYNTSASVAMNLGPLISNYSYAAGLYNGQSNNTNSTAIVVVNRVVYIPIICPAVGLAVQAISFRITGGGTGGNNCQVAVYTDVAGVPTTLVVNSVSATVPAGTGTVNVPLAFNTPATHFWVAINFDTVAVQPTCITSTGLNTGRFFAAATLGNMMATSNTCFIKAQTFGTWQATASGLTVTGSDCNLWIEYV